MSGPQDYSEGRIYTVKAFSLGSSVKYIREPMMYMTGIWTVLSGRFHAELVRAFIFFQINSTLFNAAHKKESSIKWIKLGLLPW